MATSLEQLTAHLCDRVRQVQEQLGRTPASDPHSPFAELLDSMGLVEYVLVLADDLHVQPAVIENCVGQKFTTIAELAASLQASGLTPTEAAFARALERPLAAGGISDPSPCWLAGTAIRLPETIQSAADIDVLLQRPAGWLESHAGITQRRIWSGQDAIEAAAEAGRDSLSRCGRRPDEVGVLLVTSEAAPLLAGLGAALHHRLELSSTTPALEVGGACTGFLAALWLARTLLVDHAGIMIIAVEAASHFLEVGPGESGETAALFGDGAAACLVCREPLAKDAVVVKDVILRTDGSQGHLLQPHRRADGIVTLEMQGKALAGRAIRKMAEAIRDLAQRNNVPLTDLEGIVIHGGNGRFPALLARQLGLPADRISSQTAWTGNLGSASLPVAWATEANHKGPLVWCAIGAGLMWGAAFTGGGDRRP